MIIKKGNQEIELKTSGIDFEDAKFENVNAYKSIPILGSSITASGFESRFIVWSEEEVGVIIEVLNDVELADNNFQDFDELLERVAVEYKNELIDLAKTDTDWVSWIGKWFEGDIYIQDIRNYKVGSIYGEDTGEALATNGIWYKVPSGYDYWENVLAEAEFIVLSDLNAEEPYISEYGLDFYELAEKLVIDEAEEFVKEWKREGMSNDDIIKKIVDKFEDEADGISSDTEFIVGILNGIEADIKAEWEVVED